MLSPFNGNFLEWLQWFPKADSLIYWLRCAPLSSLFLAWAAVLLGLLYSFRMGRKILKLSPGDERMGQIAGAIQEGSSAYLRCQSKNILIIGVLTCGIISAFLGWKTALSFAWGAILSGFAGYAGMYVSVRANVRTAQAAKEGVFKSFKVAFQSGAITGFLVMSLGLLGVLELCWIFSPEGTTQSTALNHALIAFGFGASLISVFARLGGGIFTKGADVGADLVGKVEQNIPEDDPRNPAVIADNVGDNVGDCAGMSGDLFQTYVVTVISTFFIALSTFPTMDCLTRYPLLIQGVCLISCLLATVFVRLGKTQNVMNALYKGLAGSIILSFTGITALTYWMCGLTKEISAATSFQGIHFVIASAIGLVMTGALVWVTEFYTAKEYRPVQSLASASVTGAATNLIQGLAISMEACFLPVLIISIGIIGAYVSAGFFGIGLAASSMLGLTAMIMSLDAYGPITDNAGGIAEMSGMNEEVRQVTDKLDSVGNTTKAVTKGYAIGSGVLATFLLFMTYSDTIRKMVDFEIVFSLESPFVVVGLLLGSAVCYLFSSMGMKAVGRAGAAVVLEVRRQFQEDPGILQGTSKPDYGRTVEMLTVASLKEMIIPSLLSVLGPLGLYALVLTVFDRYKAFITLGGFLMGLIVTGVFLALSMTSGGGAFDNAKKYIEDGHHGGKGSLAHAAAVIGDTVGDPYKDTAGPAINALVKTATLTVLLLLCV
jgi:K(+)-stimulated pyrophosphate-energized sodium pump